LCADSGLTCGVFLYWTLIEDYGEVVRGNTKAIECASAESPLSFYLLPCTSVILLAGVPGLYANVSGQFEKHKQYEYN